MRRSVGLSVMRALVVGALLVLTTGQASAQSAPRVVLAPITGTFSANPTDSGTFTEGPGLIGQDFPVLNFNPPAGTVPCTNDTGVTIFTRPFKDVVPDPDGSCTTQVAEDEAGQAGVGDLSSFDAVFTTWLMVSAPGDVNFTSYSSGGWIVGAGYPINSASAGLPTRLSGPFVGTSGLTAQAGLPVVAANNTGPSFPFPIDFAVRFPAAGIYPVEIDYAECCGDPLSLTLQANGAAIPPARTDVSVTKADSADPVGVGSSVTYTLTAHNHGPDDAMGVILGDGLPADMKFESVSSPYPCFYYPPRRPATKSGSSGSISIYGTRYRGPPINAVVCDIGVLPSGSDATAEVKLLAERPGIITNTASVSVFETVGSSLSYSGVHDLNPANNVATERTTVRAPADCSLVSVRPNLLWPPNHKFRQVALDGGTDFAGRPLALTITGVTQDERPAARRHRDDAADARPGPTPNSVLLRAERSGGGNGRVYRISFTGSDGAGGSCSGTISVGVPHDRGKRSTAVDSAPPSYSSFGP
jgi:uncharacterized repeat protein (TIGR01451 family)